MKKIRIKSRIKAPSIFKKMQGLSAFRKTITYSATMFLTCVGILAISLAGKMPIKGELREGDVSIKDIYAPFDFTYAWGIDKEKTDALKKKAASLVYDVYAMDSRQLKDIEANILKEIVSIEDTDAVRKISVSAIDEVLSRPVMPEPDIKRLLADKAQKVAIKTESGKSDVDLTDILSPTLASQKLERYIDKNLDAAKPVKKAVSDVLAGQVKPNLAYSEKETEAARKAAEESVSPIYNIIEVKKGEIIIFKGERATAQTLAKLAEMQSKTEKADNVSFLSSFALILLLLFFILAAYAQLFEPKMLKDNTGILLICILLLLIAALTKVVILTPLPSYFTTVASVSMLFTLLIGNTVVFPLIVIASIINSAIAGAELNIFMVSFIGAAVGSFAVKKARRRAHLIKAGIYVGMANFICISSLGMLNELEPIVFLKEGLWGMGGGILAAAITMVCLPIFERTLHLTTDIGLLELADLNHPLLKDMVTRATGTYHHSLIVGNLAETACDAIGANSLLARVGAYYHDIGKIAKAEYFSENQPKTSTTHEDLTPHMSSLIITNHVKDGVDLAKKYRLPQPIIDMIEQHHGSGLIYYFYQKALEKEQGEEIVEEEGFRYPGPKPQTKETAIVLLADSIEAASRTLAEPTPAQLGELVRRVINNKFIDRQLDECDLTLKEIDIIVKSFVRILVGIFHARVEYPDNGKTNKKSQ